MSFTTMVNGGTSSANDVNQYINVLQVPSAGQELMGWFISYGAYTTGALGADFYKSRNYFSVPVSVSIDTSVQTVSNCTGPTTQYLGQYGVKVYLTSTKATTNAQAGGIITLQF